VFFKGDNLSGVEVTHGAREGGDGGPPHLPPLLLLFDGLPAEEGAAAGRCCRTIYKPGGGGGPLLGCEGAGDVLPVWGPRGGDQLQLGSLKPLHGDQGV